MTYLVSFAQRKRVTIEDCYVSNWSGVKRTIVKALYFYIYHINYYYQIFEKMRKISCSDMVCYSTYGMESEQLIYSVEYL